jgi:hypothetical protein
MQCGDGTVIVLDPESGRRRLLDPCTQNPYAPTYDSTEYYDTYTQITHVPFCRNCPPACRERAKRLLTAFTAAGGGNDAASAADIGICFENSDHLAEHFPAIGAYLALLPN